MTQIFEDRTLTPITLEEGFGQPVAVQNGAYDAERVSSDLFRTDGWLTEEGTGTVVTFLSEDAAYANVLGVYLLKADSGNELIEPRIVFSRADDDAPAGSLLPGTSVDIRQLYDEATWGLSAQPSVNFPEGVEHRYGLFLISNGANKYANQFDFPHQPDPAAFDGLISFVNRVDSDDPHSQFALNVITPRLHGDSQIISADDIAFTVGGFRDDFQNTNVINPESREYAIAGHDTTDNSFIIGFEDILRGEGSPASVMRIVSTTDIESGVSRGGSEWKASESVPDGLGWTTPEFDASEWLSVAAPYPVPRVFIDGSSANLDPGIVVPGTGAQFMWQDTANIPKPDICDAAGRPDVAYFRYDFNLDLPVGAPVTAEASIVADDYFELYVNGQKIDTGILGYDPVDRIPDVEHVRFDSALANGANTIAIKAIDFGALEWVLFDGTIAVDKTVISPGKGGSDFDFNDVVISIGAGQPLTNLLFDGSSDLDFGDNTGAPGATDSSAQVGTPIFAGNNDTLGAEEMASNAASATDPTAAISLPQVMLGNPSLPNDPCIDLHYLLSQTVLSTDVI